MVLKILHKFIRCSLRIVFFLTIWYHVFTFILAIPSWYRYSVEKIPLYDSAEDEPSLKLRKTSHQVKSEYDVDRKSEYSMAIEVSVKPENQLDSTSLVVQPLESVPNEGVVVKAIKHEESEETKFYLQDTQQAFSQKNAMISRIRSNSACRNYHIGPGPMPKKRSQQNSNGRLKHLAQKHVDAKHVAQLLASKAAQEEVLSNEVQIALVYKNKLFLLAKWDFISALQVLTSIH